MNSGIQRNEARGTHTTLYYGLVQYQGLSLNGREGAGEKIREWERGMGRKSEK